MNARRARVLGSAAVSVAAIACGSEDSSRPRSPSPVAESPPVQPRPVAHVPRRGRYREVCSLNPLEQRRIAPGAQAVAIAAEGSSRVIAVARTAALDLYFGGLDTSPQSVRIDANASLFALEALGDASFALVLLSQCEEAPCLLATHVAPPASDGAWSSPRPAYVRMPTSLATFRVHAAGGVLRILRTHDGLDHDRVALDSFRVNAEGGLTAHTDPIAEALAPQEAVEALALTGTRSTHAAFVRIGAQEDDDSHVLLATSLDEHTIEPLVEALTIESVRLIDRHIELIASLEFVAPTWLRMGLDGELLAAPRFVPLGEDPPEPFGSTRRARLEDGSPMSIHVVDAAGHPTSPPAPIAPSRSADLARAAEGFLVARLDGDQLHVDALRCSPSQGEP